MFRWRRNWLIGLVVAAALVAGAVVALRPARSSGATAAPEVGHTAPSFTLSDLDGRSVSLHQYRGRVVLLNFFATWCVPCRHELPRINAAYKAHSRDLTVLAIDKTGDDAASDVRQFASNLHLAFVPLLDPSLTVWNRYLVTVQPVSFWVDRAGVIRSIDYEMDSARISRELHRLGAA